MLTLIFYIFNKNYKNKGSCKTEIKINYHFLNYFLSVSFINPFQS